MPEDKLSFIPKKTFTSSAYRARGMGALGGAAFLIFLLSAFVCGGLYLYKIDLNKKVEAKKSDLEQSQAGFELPLINKLIETSDEIRDAKDLLLKHKTIKPIFKFLEENTLQDVSYKDFKYTISDAGKPEVVLSGVAGGYGSLALQLENFESFKGKSVESVLFSSIAIGEAGRINFSADLVFTASTTEFKGD